MINLRHCQPMYSDAMGFASDLRSRDGGFSWLGRGRAAA